MKLVKFQVQNFKKIDNTGEIEVDNLTCLVGKNEAGKSAILQGLAKLNPTTGEKYDPLKEFPHGRFSDQYKTQDHWPVATGWFALDPAELAHIASLSRALTTTKTVAITRHYSDIVTFVFDPVPSPQRPSQAEFIAVLNQTISDITDSVAPDGKGDLWKVIKQAILPALLPMQQQAQASKETIAALASIKPCVDLIQSHINEAWHKERLDGHLGKFKALIAMHTDVDGIDRAKLYLAERMPKFLYFDRYDVLTSAVHLPTFKQRVASKDHGARVASCLFRHVSLDVDKMIELGASLKSGTDSADIRRQADERNIRAGSAAQGMTSKFQNWWQQRTHRFSYRFDGDYFRVWVSDDLDPSEVELDQRSAGLQYFFSFYLVFLVEQQDAHHGCILLLDEPGHFLHGTAQLKLVNFFKTISTGNQVFYTTHSPFLVPANDLHLVRAVYEDPQTGRTVISNDVWPRDKDCLFPLQAALGYELAQGLFIAPKQVIVEGITDYWILKALDQVLGTVAKTTLDRDAVIVPAAGAATVVHLASMMVGQNIHVVTLLDGDPEGQKAAAKLRQQLFVESPSRILHYAEYLTNGGTDLESIFPDDWLLSAGKAGYPSISWTFTPEETAIPNAWTRISTHIKREAGGLEKWRLISVLRDRLLASKPTDIPPTVITVADKIFQALNSGLSTPAK